jgi:hypothetical protein
MALFDFPSGSPALFAAAQCDLFRRVKRISPGDKGSLAERRGFEPPQPSQVYTLPGVRLRPG